jgi:uncharacterized protein VirK/YbjX
MEVVENVQISFLQQDGTLAGLCRLAEHCHPSHNVSSYLKRAKLVSRCLFHFGATSRWLMIVNTAPLLNKIARLKPRMLEKPFRPLLTSELGIRNRITVLEQHYNAMSELFNEDALTAIYFGDGLRLTTSDERAGYSLWIKHSSRNEKEGELGLYWVYERANFAVAQLSFSILRSLTGYRIFIGGLQGPSATNAKQLIKTATKDCDGLRPKNAVVEGLYAVAAGLGATRIAAVSNAHHVNRHWRIHCAFEADYDSFWRELGATAQKNGNFNLPTAINHRDMESVPSRKRAEFRRRRDRIGAIQKSCMLVLARALKKNRWIPRAADPAFRRQVPHPSQCLPIVYTAESHCNIGPVLDSRGHG